MQFTPFVVVFNLGNFKLTYLLSSILLLLLCGAHQLIRCQHENCFSLSFFA